MSPLFVFRHKIKWLEYLPLTFLISPPLTRLPFRTPCRLIVILSVNQRSIEREGRGPSSRRQTIVVQLLTTITITYTPRVSLSEWIGFRTVRTINSVDKSMIRTISWPEMARLMNGSCRILSSPLPSCVWAIKSVVPTAIAPPPQNSNLRMHNECSLDGPRAQCVEVTTGMKDQPIHSMKIWWRSSFVGERGWWEMRDKFVSANGQQLMCSYL